MASINTDPTSEIKVSAYHSQEALDASTHAREQIREYYKSKVKSVGTLEGDVNLALTKQMTLIG